MRLRHALAAAGKLADETTDPEEGPIERELTQLLRLQRIHFLSFLVVDCLRDGPEQNVSGPAYVVLEVCCDGEARTMRDDLVGHAPKFVRELFADCTGLPDRDDGLVRFLESHDIGADALFVSFPGKSVRQMRQERHLRDMAKACAFPAPVPVPMGVPPAAGSASLPARSSSITPRLSPTSAAHLWTRIREKLGSDPLVRAVERRPWIVRWSPESGALQRRANLWAGRVVPFIAALSVARGICWALGAWNHPVAAPAAAVPPRHTATPALVLALVLPSLLVLVGGVCISAWNAPRSLAWQGRRQVIASMAVSIAFAVGYVVVYTAMAGLAVSLALGTRPGATLFTAIVSLFLVVVLVKLGLSRCATALAAGVLLAASVVEPADLPAIPIGLLSVSLVPMALLAAVYGYAWHGRIVAAALGIFVLLGGAAFFAAAAWRFTRSGSGNDGGLVTAVDRYVEIVLAVAPLFGAGVVIAAICSIGVFLVAVRRREESLADEPLDAIRWEIDHIDSIEEAENKLGFQNHLATVSRIRSGALGSLRRVLRLVNLLARYYFTQGDLGGIQTIHFGRFVVLPDRERLLFMGNYDGGFASYLQEFNDVAGVSAIWSHCEGFPDAFLLVGDGARDEQRFKAFARRGQPPTSGWYSAYPDLSIRDIVVGESTRIDLGRPLNDPSTTWGKLVAWFSRPMTEAECDAALRRL